MAKLNKKIAGLGIAAVLLWGSYFMVSSQVAVETQANMSIFGRNVYEQTDQSGSARANSTGKKADPNYRMRFPQDHGTHDPFDIEWWYLTANLEDSSGNPYGLQWTLFRFKNPSPSSSQTEAKSPSNSPAASLKNSNVSSKNSLVTLKDSTVSSNESWHNNQIYMAHASIHSLDTHWFSEKFARGGVGNAGLTRLPLNLFIDDWQWLNNNGDKGLFPSTLTFSATDTSKPNAEAKAILR